ncbi:MAG: ASKHA domain-containing protein [Treponema sp.]|jgi:uncharacterized 2Fe-2S/4Fe-4S cluster protein (DUF4445 family)|nr:ASKHA domain-containing protein [Treponema sp.]
MTPGITVISDDQNIAIKNIAIEPGTNLLSRLQAAGISVPAICGGRGNCGTCKIKLVSGSLEPSAADKAYFSETDIQAGFRLACAAYPVEDIKIWIPETGEHEFQGLDTFEAGNLNRIRATYPRTSYAGRYVIGIDIGTTTIVLALIDTQTEQILGRLSMANKQREFGADVISRIQHANAGGLPVLSRIVRQQISEGIAKLCQNQGLSNGLDPHRAVENICKIVIAGNTTMLHLLLGLSCKNLGQAPFTPVTLDFVSCNFSELFEGNGACEVVVLPGISTYVGADIVSGIFFTEMYLNRDPTLLIDIGTNGEMAAAFSGKILCTATAAGPAFEGGNIQWGTGSVPGAIAKVAWRDERFETETIENRPPIGICGSGVVDTVYEGLKNNLILPSGRLNQERSCDGMPVTKLFLAKTQDGRDITFSQKDVRELQLAKSAIRSGIDALLHHGDLNYDAIKTFYIAGGFGYHLNFESGAGIGIIPKELQSKVRIIGNSALGGVVQYVLNPGAGETLKTIVGLSEEYRLPEDRYFNDMFIDNINFT